MSLWLPRSPPTLLARSYSTATAHHLRSHLISSLPRAGLAVHPTRPAPSSLYISRNINGSTSNASVPADPDTSNNVKPSPPVPKEAPKAPLMTRAWKKVKHEAAHYWNGTKLLVSEVRISARLQWKILHGETLTRRERRQAS